APAWWMAAPSAATRAGNGGSPGLTLYPDSSVASRSRSARISGRALINRLGQRGMEFLGGSCSTHGWPSAPHPVALSFGATLRAVVSPGVEFARTPSVAKPAALSFLVARIRQLTFHVNFAHFRSVMDHRAQALLRRTVASTKQRNAERAPNDN